VTPWKTQCASSSRPATAECSSMERQSIDRVVAYWSCAGLGTRSGECDTRTKDRRESLPAAAMVPTPQTPWGVRASHVVRRDATGRSSVCALNGDDGTTAFRVKDTATPEVKFLDRCEINSSEGVLQACVRRSRMRVRGTKMIRHRRSPAP